MERTWKLAGPAAVAILLLVAGAACSTAERQVGEDLTRAHTEGTFYQLPSPLPAGANGTLIRSERLLGAPDGAVAWRVLYRSTDVTGTPIGVSGIVVAPTAPAPAAGRTVVSWAHPTTGALGRCAPSVADDPFILVEGLHELLGAGYVVAATDYPGMGADGPASYLIGTSEGNSVLDAARAARAIPDAHAGTDLLLWGHSQGGQAALFAAQDVKTYAPELQLKGVAVAAPAVELGELLEDHANDVSGVTLTSYAFDAYNKVYAVKDASLQLSQVVSPAGLPAIPQIVPLCLLSQGKEIHAIADPLVGKFLAADPSTTPPWSTLLQQNTPGSKPIGVPMLVAQGDADDLVKPATTEQYVQTLCANGEHVQLRAYNGVNHGEVAERAVPLLIPWFADVLAGKTTPQQCLRDVEPDPTGTTGTTAPAGAIEG